MKCIFFNIFTHKPIFFGHKNLFSPKLQLKLNQDETFVYKILHYN